MENRENELHRRLARLEEKVDRLERRLEENEISSVEAPRTDTSDSADLHHNRTKRSTSSRLIQNIGSSLPRDSDFWLNKLGIGLLLLGIAFLFKYTVEQGWITPTVRVGFGLLVGSGLLAGGFGLQDRQRQFAQVLAGGGIAAYYISGFAAFQFYTLVSYPTAFIFMIAVTAAAFVLALHFNRAVLSLIGTIGGLATPFLLYNGGGGLTGLVGYTCLIISGAALTYLYRGWRSLVWIASIGCWLVFIISYFQTDVFGDGLQTGGRWVLQGGVLFAWLAFWALPVLREVLHAGAPDRWPDPAPSLLTRLPSDLLQRSVARHVHVLSLGTPLIVLSLSAEIWSMSQAFWGFIAIAGAAVYAGTGLSLKRRTGLQLLARTQLLTGVILVTIAAFLVLEGDLLFTTLVAEATALHIISHYLSERLMRIPAHLLYGLLGVWLIARLLDPGNQPAVVNIQALSDLTLIGCGILSARFLGIGKLQLTYRLLAHAAALTWIWRELALFTDGMAFITIAWGIYAVGLLLAGMHQQSSLLQRTGMITILLTVGKLFLVDLSELNPVWRILLFLGFGGGFLALSYFLRKWWESMADGGRTA